MEKLLQWGLANSVNEQGNGEELKRVTEAAKSESGPGQKYDPAILDAIMGKSDAQAMMDNTTVAFSDEVSIDDRLTAFDNLEMLVEQVDNARDMERIGIWDPLFKLLQHSNDDIKVGAATVTGAAINNDDKTQDSFMALNPLPLFISYLNSNNKSLQNKAVLNISGLLKHNPQAVYKFEELNGWNALRVALEDSNNVALQRKVAFLLNTLLLQDVITLSSQSSSQPLSTATGVQIKHEDTSFPGDRPPRPSSTEGKTAQSIYSQGIIESLLKLLPPNNNSDEDLTEKSLRVIITFIQNKSKNNNENDSISTSIKSDIRNMFSELEKRNAVEPGTLENLGIHKTELEEMQDILTQ